MGRAATPPQTEAQSHWGEPLPEYVDNGHRASIIDEKDPYVNQPLPRPPNASYHERLTTHPSAPTTTTCHHATSPSQTPTLDAALQHPRTKETLHALIAVLNDAVEGRKCTECTVTATTQILGPFTRELKQAKKNREWSKADKHALKAELKALGKRVKAQVKAAKRGERV
jgi:hypothetical protein